MLLYHGSNTGGIKRLEPRLADHDRPYIYFATNEVIAAFYMCNAVERPYYWFPYGFETSKAIPLYYELYPNALKEVAKGVKGYIYTVNAREEQYVPFKNISSARLGITPIDVIDCMEVPDAFELFMDYIDEGRMRLRRYEEQTESQLEWWYKAVASYMQEKNMADTPDCSYAKFVREKLPRAWELYAERSLDKNTM